MNNELYRKLTSITLMTIMFAGGMTIAIPGELPTAVAQTGTLSVSATGSFGGPQILEIVVNDPSRDAVDVAVGQPDVSIDGKKVVMAQANTGKWYAYVASGELDEGVTNAITGLGALTATEPTGYTSSGADLYVTDTGFLSPEALSGEDNGQIGATAWPIIQVYNLDDDSSIDVTYDDETITLQYAEDLDEDASVSTDRTEVPSGALVHVTVSDVQLNLNPTEADVWHLNTTDGAAHYSTVVELAVAWSNIFTGDTTTLKTDDPDSLITITDNATTIKFEETGSNTGVFESQDDSITINGNENQDLTIDYAGNRIQVFIGSFDSVLEMIADGTWDSGESLTVRLSDESLDKDTMTDEKMKIGEVLPVFMVGTPITLTADLESLGTHDHDNDGNATTPDVPRGMIAVGNAYVGALNISDAEASETDPVAFTIPLSEDDMGQINSGSSYVHYMGPDVTVTGINGAETINIVDSGDAPSLTAVVEIGDSITLSYNASTTENVIFDIFTFGEAESHAIYRALLKETDAGGVFEGTIEYKVLNQRTFDDPGTHMSAAATGDELVVVLDDARSLDITYGEDNASEDTVTNTGEVALDSETYRVSDDVTITLTDADLNTDSGTTEIYPIADTTGTIEPKLVDIAIGNLSCEAEIGSVSLRETADDSGVFEATFEVPTTCGNDVSTTGESITVTYTDVRDDTGRDSEWSDSATIRASTGSVSLDRTVYPVPVTADDDGTIPAESVTIYVTVDDSDENTSSSSEQTIDGVTLKVGGVTVIGPTETLRESEPDSGIFETDVAVNSTANTNIPNSAIEQGDIITVTYQDKTDASGNLNSASDSATFDLRNAVLQSDKSTYVIGQDALITLIEPDRNLDSDNVDSVDLTRIVWDSDAAETDLDNNAFNAVPQSLRETGLDTGIFQVVITIPEEIGTDNTLERGESITLTYEDRGPSGADVVGEDEREVDLLIKTSNFGATIELDQNVYTWTDKVFVTIVASDYNFDSNIIDEIGLDGDGEITIRTRADSLKEYRLAETGPDTGVFTGEVTLVGNDKALDEGGPDGMTTKMDGAGPTNGRLATNDDDGLSVSFEYASGESLVASALIRWNVGEVQWLEASYAATGSGIVRVIDPDMNINPDAVDSLEIVVYSETFVGGIELTVTETQEASGIFEGTAEFDPNQASQGHRLQVTEGDIVTAVYDDETLPRPDVGDSLEISATTLIGSIVPPLERAPASNPAIVDAFGNSLASVSVDQQVQITADLTSGQDRDQDFAYLVQIQNEDGVTVALSWITGTIGAGATFSPSQSWTPDATGSYTATIFVWESVSNPTALSPQLSITIDVV